MFKFFEGILAFLTTAINFIINLFEMAVQVVVNVGRGIALAVIFQIINKGS